MDEGENRPDSSYTTKYANFMEKMFLLWMQVVTHMWNMHPGLHKK